MAEAGTNTSAAAVPDGVLDRILEALWRSRNYLSAEKQRKLDELWNVDTFLAFGVLVAIWAGFQLLPIAWLADAALAVYGAYQLGGTLAALLRAVYEAGTASTDQALELAAQHLAHAMTDAVVDVITLIIGAAAFSRLRGLLRSWRGKILSKGSRFADAEKAPKVSETASRPKVAETSSRPTFGDRVVGVGTAVSLRDSAVAVGQMSASAWLAGIAMVLGLVLVVAGVATRTPPRRRAVYAA